MNTELLYHLPDLHDVVLGDGADHPRLDGVPGEVGDFGCVAAVNELVGTVGQTRQHTKAAFVLIR